jgi:Rrf2 family protein
VATSRVALEQNIPAAFLVKIIAQLSVAGILSTSRGVRGGVKLAREPHSITLLEVVEAMDGPIRLNDCVATAGTCALEEDCPLRQVWCDAQSELVAKLRNTNFAHLLQSVPSV